MYDMIYDVFMARCISMPMSLNGTEYMHTVTARLHGMFYMKFHARLINMPMSLNGTKHMYKVTTRVSMMFCRLHA
jgi:hypothetical protein